MFLVNIVDNDYIEGDLYKNLQGFIEANQEAINGLWTKYYAKLI